MSYINFFFNLAKPSGLGDHSASYRKEYQKQKNNNVSRELCASLAQG
jgi:hypothetical protein